jgi:hypothetical protein
VDGIAGKNTLGALYSSPAPAPAPTPTTPKAEAPKAAPPAAAPPAASAPPADAPAAPSAPTQPFTYDDFSYGDFSYNPYEQSDVVKQANALLQQQMANKPGEYQSKWESYLTDYMNRIENRDPFSYDFNSDALYNQYKDQYIQQGQMAMMDTMGQAAAMTGGYGNSYAQTVGQQAYNQQLNQLNNIMPELYGMAYDKYNQEGQDLLNMYGMYLDRENQDYGRYQDELGNWYNELDYLYNQYNTERDYDYSKWMDNRNFAYEDYVSDRNLAYDQYTSDRSLAYDEYANAINMAYNKERDAVADAQWQAEFDEGKRQYEQSRADSLAAASASRSGGGNDDPKYQETDIKTDQYYATLFSKVTSQAELDALAQRMEASGYDPDYIDAFYNQYAGTFGQQPTVPTGVPLIEKPNAKPKPGKEVTSVGKGGGGGGGVYLWEIK